MPVDMNAQDLLEFRARRAASQEASKPTPVEPLVGEDEEKYGTFGGTLGSSIEAGWDAYVAASAPDEHSKYTKRKLGKSLEEANKHMAKADMVTQTAAGVARYLPAIVPTLTGTPMGLAAGAAIGSQITAADSLVEQARQGKEGSMAAAQGAGLVQAGLDLATGGAARLAKTPVKRFFAERAGDAVSGAGGQAAINVSADKDVSDGVLEAAALSAAAGGTLDVGMSGLKRLNPWGEQAVLDTTAVEEQTGKVLPEDFKNSVIDQEDKIFNKIEELKGSRNRDEAESRAGDVVDEGVVGGTNAAIMAALRKFEGGELVPHAYDVNVAESLDGSGPTRNLAEMFGFSKKDIKESGDATLDARSGPFTKDIEGDNTAAKDIFAFKKFYDGRMADINNVFKDNASFAASLKKKYEREDRSPAEYQAVEDLGVALRNLRDSAKDGSEDFIAENAQKALARATELDVLKDLKGFSGKVGEFDPIHDIRARRIFDQIADKRLPGVRNINPDSRARGTGQSGPEPADFVPAGRTLKTLAAAVRPKASQKRLKAVKEKAQAKTRSLVGEPKRPSQKPSDEPLVEDVPNVDAELEAARAKAEEAVQAELKKRRNESSWSMSSLPKAKQKVPSDEELMPAAEAKEIFEEALEKIKPLPTGKPRQGKAGPTPSDQPRLKTDPKARQTLAEQRGLAEERKTLHDVLKRDKSASDEEASTFLDSLGDIRNNAADAGYGKNLEKYVKDRFDADRKARKDKADAEAERLAEEAETFASTFESTPDFSDKYTFVRSRLESQGNDSADIDEAFKRAKATDPSKDFDATTVNNWVKTVRKERMAKLEKDAADTKAKADKAIADEKKHSVSNARKSLRQYVKDSGYDADVDPNLNHIIEKFLSNKASVKPEQVNGVKYELGEKMRKLDEQRQQDIQDAMDEMIAGLEANQAELDALMKSESDVQAADIRKLQREQDALNRELEALRIKEQNAKTAEVEAEAKRKASEEAELEALRTSESSKQVADMEALRKEREKEKAKQDAINAAEQSGKDLDEQIDKFTKALEEIGADEATIASLRLKNFRGKTSKVKDSDLQDMITTAKASVEKGNKQVIDKTKKTIEKKVSGMSDEVLRDSGEAVIGQIIKKGPTKGNKAVSEAIADELESRGAQRDAELVRTVSEIMEVAEQRKKSFPKKPEMWVSSDAKENIQNLMKKSEGSSYAGNVLLQMRAKLYGNSEIDKMIHPEKEIEKLMAGGKPTVAKKSSGESPRAKVVLTRLRNKR